MCALFAVVVLAVVSAVIGQPFLDRVSTTSGILSGKHSFALKRPVSLFLGVPYGQAPVGSLRFKPPVALLTPDVERDASSFGPSCMQPPHIPSVVSPLLHPNRAEIDEDCLYLNIYVPERTTREESLPVMVWLPGEGFDFADPQQFDGSFLAVEGQVIVVTVNYRLSAFGFLSSLTEDAPGNAGLYDQRLALKWVKDNIEKFGGNAQNVTLFGRFTGSMSAAIHAFSPLSKEEKLFERVILQSGVPAGDWVFDKNPLNSTFALAAALNCLFSELSDIVECLRRQPAELLLTTAMSVPERFRPVYDFHLIYENSLKAVKKSNYAPIDVMIGLNNDEGTICTIALNAMKSLFYPKILQQTLTKSDLSDLVQANMLEFYKEQDSFTTKLATFFYYKPEGQIRKMFLQFCGDLYITSRSQRLADELARSNTNLYMYEFEHRPSFSIHPSFIRAGHGDDVLFSLGLPLQMTDLPEDEIKLTKQMVAVFRNFARHGDPNPSESIHAWQRYTSQTRQIMTFNDIRNKETPHETAAVFWHEIIPEAQQRACPMAPLTSALVSSEDSSSSLFLGTHVTLPVAEYLVMGLVGTSFFLLIVAFTYYIKAKKSASFTRLA